MEFETVSGLKGRTVPIIVPGTVPIFVSAKMGLSPLLRMDGWDGGCGCGELVPRA